MLRIVMLGMLIMLLRNANAKKKLKIKREKSRKLIHVLTRRMLIVPNSESFLFMSLLLVDSNAHINLATSGKGKMKIKDKNKAEHAVQSKAAGKRCIILLSNAEQCKVMLRDIKAYHSNAQLC